MTWRGLRQCATSGLALALAVLGRSAAVPADEPRLNQIQVIGSHNSYHIAPAPAVLELIAATRPPPGRGARLHPPPLGRAILATGHPPGRARRVRRSQGRAVRRAVRAKDPARAGQGTRSRPQRRTASSSKPGLKVLHVPDVDFRSTAPTFVDALKQIRAWSQANRRHVPILILVELKDDAIPGLPTRPCRFGREELEAVDAEILSVFARTEILTPDRVRGRFATLPEAIRAQGWPALDAVRGPGPVRPRQRRARCATVTSKDTRRCKTA